MALVSWPQDCKDGVYLLPNITFRNLTAVQHFYFDFSLCRWKSTQHASWLFHVNKLILPVKSQRSTSALRNASAVYTIQKIDLYIYLSIHFEIIALAYCSWPQVFLRNISTCFLFCVIYHLHRPKSNVDSNYEDLPLFPRPKLLSRFELLSYPSSYFTIDKGGMSTSIKKRYCSQRCSTSDMIHRCLHQVILGNLPLWPNFII